jgi:hypothetical protein
MTFFTSSLLHIFEFRVYLNLQAICPSNMSMLLNQQDVISVAFGPEACSVICSNKALPNLALLLL